MAIKALVFDAYGTLFDVQSVAAVTDAAFPGRGTAITQIWRLKQLEYTWLRALMDRYEDFWTVTRDSLDFTLKSLDLSAPPDLVTQIAEAYDALALYPEARGALEGLAAHRLAIFSNGSPAMLDALLRHTRLAGHFAAVLSVDAAKTYKPDPRAYALATAALDLPAARILFVTANAWDAIGAKAFGFRVAWCNRLALPFDTHGPAPDHEIPTLTELVEILGNP